MSDEIKVRKATIIDVTHVHNFIEQLENQYFDFKLFQNIYLQNLQNECIIYMVAVDKTDTCIGFISVHGQSLLHHASVVYEIQELFVEKTFRNNGIGTLLIEETEKILKLKNCLSFEVTAKQERTNAISFYLNNKFVKTHLKFTKKKSPNLFFHKNESRVKII